MKTAEDKRADQKRESWINNVMKIYPVKTRKETEELFDKLFAENQKQLKEIYDSKT